jgi:hypothetical protein
VLASLAFACATPFAAFAALAGAMLPLSAALLVVMAAWIVNQAIGFGVLGYPMEMNTLLWGLAIGVAALAATAVSAQVPRHLPAGGRAATLTLAVIAAYAVYEIVLLAFAPALGGSGDHRAAWAVKCPLDDGLGRGLRNRRAADRSNTAQRHQSRTPRTIGGNSEISFTGAGINVGGGSVNIINNWALQFQNSSTAGSASITNNAQTAFLHSGSAGTANIINNGTVQFSQSSTAGSATVTTNNAAIVHFLDTSTGGNARFITNAGGKFDMSALTSAGMTAGSIQGAGNYLLGSKTLTVGSNNLSTMVAGVISDGGGTGGALTKVGTGTLTVTGINTYTGQAPSTAARWKWTARSPVRRA